MDFFEQLRNRRSAREFLSESIPSESLAKIFESLALSPRAGNLQNFSVTSIEDSAERQAISSILFDSKTIATAPLNLIFFADLNGTQEWFDFHGAEFPFGNLVGYHFAVMDAICSAQTAALTAESLGYCTCYSASPIQRSRAVNELFGRPATCVPLLCLSIGKSNSGQMRFNNDVATFLQRNISGSKPLSASAYSEAKERADFSYLTQMPQIESQAFSSRITNTPQLLSRLKYKKVDFESFSENLAALLRDVIKADLN